MIRAQVNANDAPIIKCYIHREMPSIKGYINNNVPIIKGVIQTNTPFVIGRINRAVDHEPEPYYEVANEYGTTIIIGE